MPVLGVDGPQTLLAIGMVVLAFRGPEMLNGTAELQGVVVEKIPKTDQRG